MPWWRDVGDSLRSSSVPSKIMVVRDGIKVGVTQAPHRRDQRWQVVRETLNLQKAIIRVQEPGHASQGREFMPLDIHLDRDAFRHWRQQRV